MRIAYIAPYQGPTLKKRRPIVINLALAANIKMELVTRLLRDAAHDVEVISQGEVVERQFKFHPALQETERFDPAIPVTYASALPIRFLNGYWSDLVTLRRFIAGHRAAPFDVVIIYNLKTPQVACASYAIRRLGLPVILEYEDDVFVDVNGQVEKGFHLRDHRPACRRLLRSVSGGIGVSPHLLSQMPADVPTLLLRGVIGEDLIQESHRAGAARMNRVLYSGTLRKSKGVEPLIEAWKLLRLPDWELHIAGGGEASESLQALARGIPGVVFHGVVAREPLMRLTCSARIGANPHELSQTPGNVFAFKIIEYLAAGAHVVSTPMGALEKEVEAGITYIPDNRPGTVAAALQQVIQERRWEKSAAAAVNDAYGPAAVQKALDALVRRVAGTGVRRQKGSDDGGIPGPGRGAHHLLTARE